ncbi:alanine/arginine aminopeptidase [Verticillium dahliae VdLs.17]|uniref:Aminopeptidase n=1 Tax=Verticillium dahliae (strain VdLs.17 / ATCC MYA-4575 / FGSC 10137) TaxID=498257 RepID=G2X9V5_VERDV|nr:alanine/arginine aminopeptidase [Verticillium dahliae VdLs.17]EGY15986.1 alanine/arginine aminopeptidase [Verticillium dahliae VdLs.17]
MADRDVLPDAIRPSHYVVSLRELDFKNWTYQGTVRQVANHPIDVEVVKPTKEVVINALELKLSKASVTVTQNKSTESYESASISLDEKKQRAVIAFDQEIPASQKASVLIHFEGILNNDMAGFYRSKYTPAVTPAASVPRDDEWHYMLSTQFEPCDARRAFPCFDEPNLKATFDVELEIPDDQVALSNMPVKDTKKTRDGFHLVSFETSPKMSTYLLAWAIGDFEYVEAFTERRYNGKQLPVRVYTTRGLKEQGRWALWHAPRIIDYFSDIFGIEYPLPKADLLAVHEFSAGAMENWGLVTYRTTAVLYDEKTSEPRYANRVAYVVAHELAHQWFGNLVTMDWWDELWLNEGFATWVGWLATDHLHPEWQVWPQFINEGMEMAFKLDSIRASHAIHVPVKDALDVNQIFDHISYLKGCSAIRMLANHLASRPSSGRVYYLKKHQYTPLLASSHAHRLIGAQRIISIVLQKKEDTITDIDSEFYKLNSGASGFYRVNYPPERLLQLGKQLDRLSIEDKIAIIGSAGDLAFSGNGTTAALLSFIQGFSKEDNYLVWSQVLDSIASVKSVFGEDEVIKKGLEAFTLKLIDEAVSKVGWDYPEGESYLTGLLRKRLILTAGVNGHASVTEEALKRWKAYVESPESNPLPPALRTPVFRVAVKHDPVKAVEVLKKEWFTTKSIDGKEVCLSAISAARDTELVKKTILPFLFNRSPPAPASESVPSSDMHVLASGLGANASAREAQWQYLQAHWDDCVVKAGNNVVVDRLVSTSLSKFADADKISEIDAFFAGKDTAGFNRTLETAKDKIRGRAAYRQRDAAALKAWLAANGYAA